MIVLEVYSQKEKNTNLTLHDLVNEPGKDCVWHCIEKAISDLGSFPILHQTIKYSPKNCGEVLKRFPDSILV